MAQNVVINGVTYSNVPEVDIPKSGSGTAKFYDTASASFSAADLLTGKSAYGTSGSVNGSMANNGAVSATISTKDGSVTIPVGYTSGGSVTIAPAAVSDLTSAVLLSGNTVLGVNGELTVPTISQDGTTHILSIS